MTLRTKLKIVFTADTTDARNRAGRFLENGRMRVRARSLHRGQRNPIGTLGRFSVTSALSAGMDLPQIEHLSARLHARQTWKTSREKVAKAIGYLEK